MKNINSSPNPFLKEFIAERPIVISPLLLKYYTKLNMDEVELVTVLQLIRFKECQGEKYPTVEELEEVMTLGGDMIKATLARLIEKHIIAVEHSSNMNNFGKSFYVLDPLWDKLLAIWEQEKSKKASYKQNTPSIKLKNVYTSFEREFGRLLSPIESSKIVQWCENDGFSSELILEALERAVLQGALSFKYIDSILRTWANQNLKTVAEVMQYELEFNNRKNKKANYQRYKTNNKHDKFSEIYVT